VSGDWGRRRVALAGAFDVIAGLYRREFSSELDHKPFDRALLDRVAGLFPAGRPVLEVGAGPGQVGLYLAGRGVPVLCSDASVGQLHEARRVEAHRSFAVADLMSLPVGPVSLAGVLAFYCLIYGPPQALDPVFSDWFRALAPGGLVVASVHAGEGTRTHRAEWQGERVAITVTLRDPDDLVRRMAGAGLEMVESTRRAPYPEEGDTERLYVVARRPSS
jgi:SAM-dependent methyltransferase